MSGHDTLPVLSPDLDARYSIPPVHTLPQMLVARAKERPDRICQREKDYGIWKPYTWAEVLEHVRSLALGLYDMGLRKGGAAAVVGENEPEHFWAEYAIQAVGAKVVSLYPDLTPEEMAYTLEDSGATLLIAEDQEQIDKGIEVASGNPNIQSLI